MTKRALITGISGQDGSYLSELLLAEGYEVYGTLRRHSLPETQDVRIQHLSSEIHTEYCDVTDANSIGKFIREVQPDEIYNLAAQSHVQISFSVPEYTIQTNTIGVLNILEAVRQHSSQSKVYQACHDTKTKALTPKGIIPYYKLKPGDEVITINERTNKIEIKKIKKVLVYDYEGEMIKIKGKRVNQLLTPNHNVLLQKDDSDIVRVKASNVADLFPYKTSRCSEYNLPRGFNHIGKNPEVIKLSDIDYAAPSVNTKKNLVETFNAKDLFYLIGLYIGDGYTATHRPKKVFYSSADRNCKRDKKTGRFIKETGKKKLNHYQSDFIQFAIPENDKARQKLINVLKRNNISYHEHQMTIGFSSRPLRVLLKKCGPNVYKKQIPDFVWDFSKDLIHEVLIGIVDSDGHYAKSKNTIKRTISTVSKKLVSDICRACFMIGIYPHVLERKPQGYWGDRTIVKGKTSYNISLSTSRTNKIYPYLCSTVWHNNKVWCLEVEDNHNFLIYRDGKVAFSGNSSSEVYGDSCDTDGFQRETTNKTPVSPYGCSKLMAYHLVRNYRRAYGLYACNGILFNHSSPRRGLNFVEQKIVYGAVRIKLGLDKKLELGNLESKRDFGHSRDYMTAIVKIINHSEADDFVIATGQTRSVREVCDFVFEELGLDYRDYVTVNPAFLRPQELPYLRGDSTKARTILGWEPKYTAEDLLREMIGAAILKVEGEEAARHYLDEVRKM